MRALLNLILLRPHGRNLCSMKADMWLLLLRLNILLILTAEGLAWGFIGKLMGAQTSPWAGALLVGGIIVLLVGSIDSAFALLDLTHVRISITDSTNGLTNWGARVKAFFAKYGNAARIGLVVRIIMVIGSLLITSPFLAQLMFSTDIANLRKTDYDQAVAAKQEAILTQFDSNLQKLRAQRDAAASEYSREIAGKGLSGRFGRGPVARSLAEQLLKLNEQIRDVEEQKQSTLTSFQNASPATRAQQFGVAMASDGIAMRFEALGRMEAIPGFRRAENAIRVILFGLFLGLLLLKWYEPTSLQIYLDEELQDAFLLYNAGYYDHWHDRTKLSSDKMTPFAFRDWYYKTEKRRAKTLEIREKMAALSSRQTDIESTVRRLSDGPAEDMAALAKARTSRAQALEEAAEVVRKLQEQSSAIDGEVALCETELLNAARTISEEPRFSASAVLLKKQQAWEERQTTARTNQRLHTERLKNALQIRDARAKDVEDIDKIIQAQNAILAELANASAEARRAALQDLRDVG